MKPRRFNDDMRYLSTCLLLIVWVGRATAAPSCAKASGGWASEREYLANRTCWFGDHPSVSHGDVRLMLYLQGVDHGSNNGRVGLSELARVLHDDWSYADDIVVALTGIETYEDNGGPPGCGTAPSIFCLQPPLHDAYAHGDFHIGWPPFSMINEPDAGLLAGDDWQLSELQVRPLPQGRNPVRLVSMRLQSRRDPKLTFRIYLTHLTSFTKTEGWREGDAASAQRINRLQQQEVVKAVQLIAADTRAAATKYPTELPPLFTGDFNFTGADVSSPKVQALMDAFWWANLSGASPQSPAIECKSGVATGSPFANNNPNDMQIFVARDGGNPCRPWDWRPLRIAYTPQIPRVEADCPNAYQPTDRTYPHLDVKAFAGGHQPVGIGFGVIPRALPAQCRPMPNIR